MSYLVLFQKQISVEPGYELARVVTVFTLNGTAIEEALKQVKWNYTPWLIPFKELPPEKVLLLACEEAVRAGKVQLLPLAVKPKDSKLAQRIANGLATVRR